MPEYSSMAQQLNHPASEVSYIIILLLLSYVMSSAPKYVRDWRENQEKTIPRIENPGTSWKEWITSTTIAPYLNAWKKLQESPQITGLAAKTYLPAQ
jgi:hypothetical protein